MATATLAVALAVGSTTFPARADNDAKDKLSDAEKAVEHAEDDLHESSKALQKASARLAAAKDQLVSAQAALAAATSKVEVAAAEDARMQAELAQAESELAQAELDLAQGVADRQVQREEVADTILSVYMDGDPELLAFASILQAETTGDLALRDQAREVVVGRETRAYDSLKAAEVLLGVREQEVTVQRDSVAAKRAEAAEHLAYREGVEAERAAAEASVNALVTERSAARGDARKARAKDQVKLKQAEAEARKWEEILRKRAAAALRKARRDAALNNSRSLKGPSDGLLSMPVQGGYVTSSYGYRTHPIYGYYGLHDGTDFGGGCGLPLVAAADGVVLKSYWSSVYGNRLVVDYGVLAGKGVASIYNHATRYTVSSGERVKRGEVIGYTGDTGWSTACHLHFTVMVNGSTVNPMDWL